MENSMQSSQDGSMSDSEEEVPAGCISKNSSPEDIPPAIRKYVGLGLSLRPANEGKVLVPAP